MSLGEWEREMEVVRVVHRCTRPPSTEPTQGAGSQEVCVQMGLRVFRWPNISQLPIVSWSVSFCRLGN